MKKSLLLIIVCLFLKESEAQFYQATHGSNYSGSLGIFNNPASGLSSPDPWDMHLFGIQTRNLMNLLYAENYASAGSKKQLSVFLTNGDFKRNLNSNFNINLINTRIRINNRLSVGFGLNLRSLSNMETTRINLQDSFPNIDSFFVANFNNQPLGASLTSSTWSETFGNISFNIIDNKKIIWNLGVNLKSTRGLIGVHAKLNDAQFRRVIPAFPFHNMTDLNLLYFYSGNIDEWSSGGSFVSKVRNHLKRSELGGSIDFGMEWIFKDTKHVELFENTPLYEYKWKLGLSLLDLGYAQYENGLYAMNATGISPNINAVSLNKKFTSGINTIKNFHDTLRTLVQTYTAAIGKFRFAPPARIVVNIDRSITSSLFVNSELNLPVSILPDSKFYTLKMVPSLSITPRIERKGLGVYMPMSLNSEGSFWLGMALRTGPFLMGFHDINPFLRKSPYLNGGGYISFVISPSDKVKKVRPQEIKCPK